MFTTDTIHTFSVEIHSIAILLGFLRFLFVIGLNKH